MEIFTLIGEIWVATKVLGFLAPVAIAGVYGGYKAVQYFGNSMGDGLKSFKNSLDKASENRQCLKTFNAVSSEPDLFKWFQQKSVLEQETIICRWAKSAKERYLTFTSPQIKKMLPCFEAASKSIRLTQDFRLAKDIFWLIAQSKSGDENVSQNIINNIFGSLKDGKSRIGFVTPEAVKAVAEIPRECSSLVRERDIQACKSFIVGALNFRDIYKKVSGPEDFLVQAQALEVLFFPRYSYGGEKSTALLSMELGEYSFEEKREIYKNAEIFLNRVNAQTKGSYPAWAWRERDGEKVLEISQSVEKILAEMRRTEATQSTVRVVSSEREFNR